MIELKGNHAITVDAKRAETIIGEIQSNPMGGWFDLPANFDISELAAIKNAADRIKSDSQYLVCVGIGGSYLGHKAIIDALQPSGPTEILYAGNSLSARALEQVLQKLGDADFSINVISKSGTTTEPAVAFRILKQKLIEKYGDRACERIYATTDAAKGALYDEAVAENYTRFVVPDDIGGRYSVLSAVGLLPLAAANVDIEGLLSGAASERQTTLDNIASASAVRYAFARAELQRDNYNVEVLASFEPEMQTFTEWWKQLFGESEGKQRQGIFPASVIYTTDLHSLGQYLQEGRRNIFETVLDFQANNSNITVPTMVDDLDGLAYLEGKKLSELNHTALVATVNAHRDGGIPVFELSMPAVSERTLGALVFFFELSCAMSATLSGVNPFDQPGVEAYKTNMFKLLGKPGF